MKINFRIMTRFTIAHLVFAVLSAMNGAAEAASPRLSPAVLTEVRALNGRHPAEYYRRASTLFGEGRKDEAVFVFYLGQLRYRAHLAARLKLPADGDPALFASLSQTVGQPVNEYAFGDLAVLVKTVDAVLEYDQREADRFTPPSVFPEAFSSVRNGLTEMKAALIASGDTIREQRRKNGLSNRN